MLININNTRRQLSSKTAQALVLNKVRQSGRQVRLLTRNNTLFFLDGSDLGSVFYQQTRAVPPRRYSVDSKVGRFYLNKLLEKAAVALDLKVA